MQWTLFKVTTQQQILRLWEIVFSEINTSTTHIITIRHRRTCKGPKRPKIINNNYIGNVNDAVEIISYGPIGLRC